MASTRTTVTTVVASISLVALALTDFYVTNHSSATLDKFFPSGREYAWLGAPGSKQHYDIVFNGVKSSHKISLSYDWSSEYFVWASSGMSVLAGSVCVGGALRAMKVPIPHTPDM
jgi:hypothetical protein